MNTIGQRRDGLRLRLIEQLRKDLQRIRLRQPVQRAWLFGSYARGDFCATSDADVLCVTDAPLDAMDFNVPCEVDVICIKPADFDRRLSANPLLQNVIVEGVEL
jgi:predicted nucleotidyltransferase